MVLVEGSGASGEEIVGDGALPSQRRSQVRVPPTFTHSFVTHVGHRQQPLEPAVGDPVARRVAVDMLGDHLRRRRFVVCGDVPQGAGRRPASCRRARRSLAAFSTVALSPSTRSLLPKEVITAIP